MFPHARKGHVEPLGKGCDRSVRSPELLQYAASGGVRERAERGVVAGLSILNHMVHYNSVGDATKLKTTSRLEGRIRSRIFHFFAPMPWERPREPQPYRGLRRGREEVPRCSCGRPWPRAPAESIGIRHRWHRYSRHSPAARWLSRHSLPTPYGAAGLSDANSCG